MSEKKGKTKKPFSFDQFHERQIALRIAYIGWDLKGFVMQKDTEETVEGYIFRALDRARLIKNMDRQVCHYSLCGRTDVGVSGIGNVISVRVRSVFPSGKGSIKNEKATVNKEEELNYLQILNGILPPMIRVTAVAYVDPDFNARYACTSRSYRYLFHKFNKNLDKMREAASYLIGEHDYRGFCKFSPNNTSHCVRKIFSIDFNEISNGLYYFQIVGSGFIWHQIRCIASILFMVGDGFEEPTIVQDLLDVKRFPGRPQYAIADPKPLIFWMAEYDGVEWQVPKDNEIQISKLTTFNTMLTDHDICNGVLRLFNGGGPTEHQVKKKHTPVASLQLARSVEELLEEHKAENEGNAISDEPDYDE
ncbi:tRNA pseudouridine synthase A family protein [Tritrichomonas foetus]|uniref:tRNA pseudouridine synthase n=1 Tax=Tritrichomonas foetus TaxID=1144522 RepID=A0A1J4KJ35_9EUKA|nr:tRNA pseudouridine synthase A family protein [Tritrichomonas foetus]|eukprot:OHT09828.1 tRNA pseudouridine synthase A family protein [Tritrichomonas foetus]